MALPKFMRKWAQKKAQKKAEKYIAPHAQHNLETHGAKYGQAIGDRAAGYAERNNYTNAHAAQIGDWTSRGATAGLGVVAQHAGRQELQYGQSNHSTNSRNTRPTRPHGSAWERRPGANQASHGYCASSGLRPARAAENNRMQTKARTGGRIDVVSSQDTWYMPSNAPPMKAGTAFSNLEEYVQNNKDLVEPWHKFSRGV